jgi:plasmid stabilization system protein ParE
MAKKIIITKRFRRNVKSVYDYISIKFSARTADIFLNKIEKLVELILLNPDIGRLSQKRKGVRCVHLTPHNLINYRIKNDTVEILCLFDMRRSPDKRPY